MKNTDFRDCIEACQACVDACLHCMSSCLGERNVTMFARCIKLDRDCAAICSMAVQAMAGDSVFAKKICALCAEVCIACSNECEKHVHMAHCKACAEACRECAAKCEQMSNAYRLEVA